METTTLMVGESVYYCIILIVVMIVKYVQKCSKVRYI